MVVSFTVDSPVAAHATRLTGPGCSSSLGVYVELGPCRVVNDTSTVFHPESWNSNANIFFVDQPIGVGFSYADYGETVVGRMPIA